MKYFLQGSKYIVTTHPESYTSSMIEVSFYDVFEAVVNRTAWGLTILDYEVVSMIGSSGTPILSVGHGPVLGINFERTTKTITHAIKGTKQTIGPQGDNYIARFDLVDGLPEWILDYEHIISVDTDDLSVYVSTNNETDALSMRMML